MQSNKASVAQSAAGGQRDEILEFTFDTNGATFERSGDDLIIIFKDGNQIVLHDFYVEEGDSGELPALHLTGVPAGHAGEILTLESVLDVREPEIFPAVGADPHPTVSVGEEEALHTARMGQENAGMETAPGGRRS